MKFLIYAMNYAPELTGTGRYSTEMAEWFAVQGHEVRVICAPPYYPQWRLADNFSAWRYAKNLLNAVRVFRCPLYIPKQPKTLSRLLHLASFALSSFPLMLCQLFWRPDVILTVQPTFFCTPATLLLAKLSGAKSVLHVQDYELDAMLGLGMVKRGTLARFAYKVEAWIMRRFDLVSSISFAMVNKAEFKTQYAVATTLFPNWANVDFVTPQADADFFRQCWGISPDIKVVLYSGNMGKKQGLELVIEAADQFKNEQDILFIMVGAGAVAVDLKILAADLNLHNIQFHPLQSYQHLPCLMALADVHLVVQKKGIADVVLPSKLTTIFSMGGHALMTAEEDTELGLLCANFPGIATRVEPECIDSFVAALSGLLSLVNVNKRVHNPIARNYVVDYLSKDLVLCQYEQTLKDLCQ